MSNGPSGSGSSGHTGYARGSSYQSRDVVSNGSAYTGGNSGYDGTLFAPTYSPIAVDRSSADVVSSGPASTSSNDVVSSTSNTSSSYDVVSTSVDTSSHDVVSNTSNVTSSNDVVSNPAPRR